MSSKHAYTAFVKAWVDKQQQHHTYEAAVMNLGTRDASLKLEVLFTGCFKQLPDLKKHILPNLTHCGPIVLVHLSS